MLPNSGLFLPMFCLVFWTLAMMARLAALRVIAVRSGQIKLRFFEVYKGGEQGDVIVKTSNNYNNLLQIPQLFYVICLFISFRSLNDEVLVAAAWLYVVFRIAHSLVHISINKVNLRFICFLLSNICLGVLWIRTFVLLGAG